MTVITTRLCSPVPDAVIEPKVTVGLGAVGIGGTALSHRDHQHVLFMSPRARGKFRTHQNCRARRAELGVGKNASSKRCSSRLFCVV